MLDQDEIYALIDLSTGTVIGSDNLVVIMNYDIVGKDALDTAMEEGASDNEINVIGKMNGVPVSVEIKERFVMGNMQTFDMAESIEAGAITLREACMMQVRSNMYPPLPKRYGELLEEAVKYCHDGSWNTLIEVTGLDPIPREVFVEDDKVYVKAGYLVNICHADSFVVAYHA